MITYFHILLAWARAPSQERTHDFPIKIFSISNHEPNLRTYLPSHKCGASTLHSPVAMPMVASGQWSPVVSSGPGVICSTFIAPSSDTQPAPLHTTTQGYHGHMQYGDWEIFCICHKICVPLVPVDYKTEPPLALSSQVCQVYNLQTNLRPVTA